MPEDFDSFMQSRSAPAAKPPPDDFDAFMQQRAAPQSAPPIDPVVMSVGKPTRKGTPYTAAPYQDVAGIPAQQMRMNALAKTGLPLPPPPPTAEPPDPVQQMRQRALSMVPTELRGFTPEEGSKVIRYNQFGEPISNYGQEQMEAPGNMMGAGVAQMASGFDAPGGVPRMHPRALAGGAAKVLGGAGEVSLPQLAPTLALDPVAGAAGLAAGTAASKAAEHALRAAGAPDEYVDLGSQVAGLVAGGVVAHRVGKIGQPPAKGTASPKGPRFDSPDTYPAAQYGVPRLNAPAGEVGAAPPETELPKRPTPDKPTKTQTVSPQTPNPPTAAKPTVPENPATLAAQTDQLVAGQRKVVMYPKGTPAPTSFPQNSAVTSDRFGNTYVFRPDLITRAAIKKAAENNTLNEILGDAEMGMGVPDKSAIPPDSPTVVARDAQGNEVHAALTPEENAATAVEVAHRLTPSGGSVSVEPPSTVIGQRMAEFGGNPVPAQTPLASPGPPPAGAPAGGIPVGPVTPPVSPKSVAFAPVRPDGVQIFSVPSDGYPPGRYVVAAHPNHSGDGGILRDANADFRDIGLLGIVGKPIRAALAARGLTPKNIMGEADIAANENGDGNFYSTGTHVAPEWQRRRVASDMYSHAENVLGSKIVPAPVQTEDGKALTDFRARQQELSPKPGQELSPRNVAKYKSALAEHLPGMGIEPSTVANFRKPILVRELLKPLGDNEVRNAITDLNKKGPASLKPEAQAVVDGRRLSNRTLALITGNLNDLGEDGTLRQAITGEKGAEIIMSMVNDGIMPDQEKGQYLEDRNGKSVLTESAKDRIAKALVGRLFSDPKDLKQTPPELRQKLERIAPQLLRVSDRPDWDILPQVRTALGYMADAKAHGTKNLTQLATQEGFDGKARSYEPEALAIAQKLYEGPNKSSSAFRRYANDAELSRPGAQAALMEPPTQEEAFRDAFEGGAALPEQREPIKLPAIPPEEFVPGQPIGFYAQRAIAKEVPVPDEQTIAVLVNPSAMEVFGRVAKQQDGSGDRVLGTYIPKQHVFQIAMGLGNVPSKGMAPMIAAFQEAALNNKDVIVVKARAGQHPADLQKALTEELNHARQERLDYHGIAKHLVGDWEEENLENFNNNPLVKRATQALGLFYGYNGTPSMMAAEIGVRLMVPGRYGELGLNPQDARTLAALYVKSLRKAYGKLSPAEIAQDVFDALRPSRTSAGGAKQSGEVTPSPGLQRGSGAAEGIAKPDTADSEGRTDSGTSTTAVQPTQAGRTPWTPWSKRIARQEQPGLFSEPESAATAADVAKDRDKLQGERLTAQFNSPMTRGEQKLKKAKVEQTGLFEEPKPEKAQKGLFESREPTPNWQDKKLKKLSPEANQLWDRLKDIEPITDMPVSVSEINLPHDVMTKGAQELHKAGLIYGTLHDGSQAIPDDLLIPTGNKSHYGGDGKWINVSRRGEPVKASSVTLGAGLGPLEPFLGEHMADVKQGFAEWKMAREALKRGKATPANKEDGNQILRYTTSNEDWWKARVNQAIEKLQREVPNLIDREAITIMRDFANNPGEIRKWLDGTAADYPTTPEGIRNLKRVETIIKRAINPSQKMIDVNKALTSIAEVSYHEGKRLGILDSSITPDEYVAHLLRPKDQPDYPETKDRPRGLGGGRLTNYLANAQKRFYPTVLHAIADNVKPQTLDALDAFRIYGDRFARRRATELLKNEIVNAKIGFWGKENAPKGYVQLAPHSEVFKREFVGKDEDGKPQVGHTGVYVPPWLEKALRPITDPDATQFIHGFKTLQAYQAYIKAAQLSLSLFHLYTENVVSIGDVGMAGRWKIANMDRFSPEFQRAELYAIKRGVKTSVIDQHKDAWRRLDPGPIPTLRDIAKRLPLLKQADQLGNAIGDYTFNNFVRKAKVFAFFSRSAEWRGSHPQATEEATIRAEQGIAKYVNAAYGGLHWENMGMGRTAQNLSRIILMAPDWVYSNYILGKYAVHDWKDPESGKFSFTGNTAGHLSRKFFLRTLLYGAIGTAVMSYMFTGKWNKDWTRVHFGQDEDGKDIVANLAFRASAGDMVTLAHNVAQYGVVAGIGKTYANKAAAVPRAALHVATNSTGQLGQSIASPGMNPVASTVRGLKTVVTDVSPVPFILSNSLKAKEIHRKWWEYLIMVLTGQPPQHITPQGMHVRKGQMVPDKPIPEERRNSIWDQIRTGKVYKSKKEMRDLSTPPAY